MHSDNVYKTQLYGRPNTTRARRVLKLYSYISELVNNTARETVQVANRFAVYPSVRLVR